MPYPPRTPPASLGATSHGVLTRAFRLKALTGILAALPFLFAIAATPAQGQDRYANRAGPAARPAAPAPRPSPVEFHLAKLDRVISICVEDATLEEALEAVSAKADLRISKASWDVLTEQTVTLDLRDVTALEALHEVTRGAGLQLRISPTGHLIVAARSASAIRTGLGAPPPAQTGTIAGRVTDAETGESLPGVNVVVEGTRQGAAADPDGRYTITGVDPGTYSLRASFLGYRPEVVEDVVVEDGQTAEVDFELVGSAVMLDEVVAVGYGELERRDVTGAVRSVTADEFAQGVNTSPSQLLQGKVSGAQVTQTTGEPGGAMSVRIRGASSINADNEPLYVIDGYPIDNSPTIGATSGGTGLGADPSPRDPLSTLNPSDIASIEILKDASATAIYGSRGANGVVLITTKKGNRNDFQVDYSASTGVQAVADRIEVLAAAQYVDVINGIAAGEGREPAFTQEDLARIGDGTNWQDEIYRPALVTNHNLAFSGGSESTVYRTSLNYFNQRGVVKNTGIEKYIGRLNLQRDLPGGRGSIGTNVNASLVDNQNSTENLTINESSGPIKRRPPVRPHRAGLRRGRRLQPVAEPHDRQPDGEGVRRGLAGEGHPHVRQLVHRVRLHRRAVGPAELRLRPPQQQARPLQLLGDDQRRRPQRRRRHRHARADQPARGVHDDVRRADRRRPRAHPAGRGPRTRGSTARSSRARSRTS